MSAAIRELCLLAVLCAAVTSICPEGNVKKICSLTCSIVMITAALKPLAGFDFNEYAVQLAHYREMGAALTESSQELDNRLNRLVIEEECSAYIWDKAREYGVELTEVRVTAAWSTDGFWYPEGAVISCPDPAAASQALSGVIERELGILESAQHRIFKERAAEIHGQKGIYERDYEFVCRAYHHIHRKTGGGVFCRGGCDCPAGGSCGEHGGHRGAGIVGKPCYGIRRLCHEAAEAPADEHPCGAAGGQVYVFRQALVRHK